MSEVISIRLNDRTQTELNRLLDAERRRSDYPVTVNSLITRLIQDEYRRSNKEEQQADEQAAAIKDKADKLLYKILKEYINSDRKTLIHYIDEYNGLIADYAAMQGRS